MNVKMTLKRNSPKILTILAAMGTVSTAFATARATPKALLLIREAESQKGEDLTALEKVKVAAVPYIPAVLLGSAKGIAKWGYQPYAHYNFRCSLSGIFNQNPETDSIGVLPADGILG